MICYPKRLKQKFGMKAIANIFGQVNMSNTMLHRIFLSFFLNTLLIRVLVTFSKQKPVKKSLNVGRS